MNFFMWFYKKNFVKIIIILFIVGFLLYMKYGLWDIVNFLIYINFIVYGYDEVIVVLWLE